MEFPWWDKKNVSLFDQILFLPPVLSNPVPIAFNQELYIEFCSGNGLWVVQKALDNPGNLWVAVEKKLERAKKIWNRAKRLGAQKLLVVCGSAENMVTAILPSPLVKEVFINFPDPWPKFRHAKHRLIQDSFVMALQNKMVSGGKITFVTDDISYLEQGLVVLKKTMKPLLPEPFYSKDPENYGSSFFEEMWRKKNKTIYYTAYANY